MATIRDIAKESNVSAGAVSRILNNDATLSVSPETRMRVIEIARKLNYVKKETSRPSVNRSLFTLGLVQWFSAEEERKDNYYVLARQGIEDFCAKNSISIVRIYPNDIRAGRMDTIDSVNGLICLGKFSKAEVSGFISRCKNIVFLDMPVEAHNITSLSMDFEKAVYDALDYLSLMGHKKIGFLGGKEYVGDHKPLDDPRTIAYQKYMEHRGLDSKSYFIEGSFNSNSGYEMMKQMLESEKIPTAVFAASDAIAFGAMKAITEKGLSVPNDISIIGFNDEPASEFMNPPLTTINAPAYDMGQHGANLIFVSSNLSINTPLKAKIPCQLIKRSSVRQINE